MTSGFSGTNGARHDDWTHAAPKVLAAFLASLVEVVEALTG
jgi:hypothetical protein